MQKLAFGNTFTKNTTMETIKEKQIPCKLIMLIDDSSIDNFVNQRVVLRYGFSENVIAFTKTRQGLQYLLKINTDTCEEEIPSFIFLDLNMPEIDGFEFLAAFSLLSDLIKNKMKIVVLTSSINPADVEVCKKYPSVLTFLHKPLVKSNLDAVELMLQSNSNGMLTAIGA